MNICIAGTGYVGLVTGACFAGLGNRVVCVDKDRGKIGRLKKGIMPIYEPHLKEMVTENVESRRLDFTSDMKYGVENSSVIFIAVGTPSLQDGDADLSCVKEAAREIAGYMNGYKIIVNKSTVPVGTQKQVGRIIHEGRKGDYDFDVVSNPEFLREGSAVYDFLNADRVIIGTDSNRAADIMTSLYEAAGSRIMVTDPESAEMIKYASNAFLALKITFINEIANICERIGGDVSEVARGMGMDHRISDRFLTAGIGYGGSCFPKDCRAVVKMARKAGYSFETVESAIRVNERQRLKPVDILQRIYGDMTGRVIGILGLSFKPGTDDMREAPSVYIIRKLVEQRAVLKAYDPAAVENARQMLEGVEFCSSAYEAAAGADALVLVTEWEEFGRLNLSGIKQAMRKPVFIDGRNMFGAEQMEGMGFEYYCIGKKGG